MKRFTRNREDTMKTSSTAARIFSLTELEADIQNALTESPPRQAIEFAPPSYRAPVLPLPPYLEHREGADEIGKLSAEAVAKSYEAAAAEIEKMGAELKERTEACEKMVIESNKALDQVRETAAAFRDAGKAIFLQIEDCSLMTAEVRSTCDALKTKIANASS